MLATLDVIGIFAFGISGALMAIRRDFDVVGIAIMAVVTALGGGILRDLVLGDTPPVAFTRSTYLLVPLAAAAVAFVAHRGLQRLSLILLAFDAAGLGLFCVAGTVKALDHGLAPPGAAILGATTAVGGGVLRDVIARETPALVRPDSELYAVPAVAGALAVAIATDLGVDHPILLAAAATAISGTRLLALHRHWHGPRARQRSSSAHLSFRSWRRGTTFRRLAPGHRARAGLHARRRPRRGRRPISGGPAGAVYRPDMERPVRFEHNRYVGDKRTQVVHDVDACTDESIVDELMASEAYLCFGPDTLPEARNRGYKRCGCCGDPADDPVPAGA